MKELNEGGGSSDSQINIREIIASYLKHWKWFALSLVLCIGVAYAYLRYATFIYEAEATVMLKTDDQKSAGLSTGGGMEQFDFMGMMGANIVEDEIEVLKSRRLIKEVVHTLDLQTVYRSDGRVKSLELYKQAPIDIQVHTLGNDSVDGNYFSSAFQIKHIDDFTFEYSTEEGMESRHIYDKETILPFGIVTISKLRDYSSVNVSMRDVESTAAAIRNGLNISVTTKGSKVINLRYAHANKQKAADILNTLIEQYNQDAVNDKNEVLSNTAEFIDERLAIISEELDVVESSKEHFKISQGLTNIEQESQIFLQSAKENRTRLLEVNTELELSKYMIDYITNSKDDANLLPANLGFTQTGIDRSIGEFNGLVLERNKVLVSSTLQNPVLVSLNERIASLKASILESLNNLKKSLEITKRELEQQERIYSSQIAQAPMQEKKFRGIERQQEIKETLYLFLLQKREEIAINLAVTAPVAKVIDQAYVGRSPIAPKTRSILMVSVILGLLIPAGFIYFKFLFDNKVRQKNDILSIIPNATILGETPFLYAKDNRNIEKNDRSILAESFRIIQTNLNYLFLNIPKKSDQAKHIQVTSTIAAEGKTLTSVNLAISLAYANKKVLLVGADLRNPQFKRYYNQLNNRGLSDYLFDENLNLSDIIQAHHDIPNLSIIPAGTLPPNPAELLMTDRVSEFFENVGEGYDYVIADTAPLLLVTDTLLINQYADAMIYVVRSGETEKNLMNFAKDSLANGKIKNVGFVLNGVKAADYGYGNKYGYGYGSKK